MVLAGLGAAVLLRPQRAAAQSPPAVQRLLDRARAASGGRAWNAVRGLHESGLDAGQRFERWLDPLRYGLRAETTTPAGKLVTGYNGAAAWLIGADGRAFGPADQTAIAQIRAEAFFGACGYFFPSRFDVRSAVVGGRQAQGRAFDLVKIHPEGAKARTLWFDRKTGLLDRLVDDTGGRPVTLELSDYRKVSAVQLPFRRIAYGGDLPRPREQVIERIDLQPVDRAIFSLPRGPDGRR
jgi:hypothetical protein